MTEENGMQENLTAEEKKRDLYLRQKHTLDLFLERGAISQAQYDKSLGDLTVKMSMEPEGMNTGLSNTDSVPNGEPKV